MAVRMTRSRRLMGRFNLLVSAVLALFVWLGVAALATRPAFKSLIDLTPQAQFTVSDESKALLRDLAATGQHLRIDTFYARLPQPQDAAQQHYVNIQRRIQQLTNDLLLRYAELGGDHVEVHHFDVLGDVAAARARIQSLGGLQQENVLVVSLGPRHKELQLSLDLAEIDFPSARMQTAPGADRGMPTLKLYKGEEAISSAIRSLLVEGRPQIYFLEGYNGAELQAGTALSYSQMLSALSADGFRIGLLNLEEHARVPEDADIIAVMEPRNEISPRAAEALFAWVRNGGRLLVDLTWSEVSGSHWNPTWGELGRLCGFEFGTDLVCHLVPDPNRAGAPGIDGEVAAGLVLTGLAPHPITRPLAQMRKFPQFTLAREVRELEGAADTTFEPILQTGPHAWLAPRAGELGADFTAPEDPEAFAVRTVGAVLDVAPAAAGGRYGHVVLFGGLAFVNGNDMFARNADLALNTFNWLAERPELVTVRGNRYRSERIEVVPQQIERAQTLVRVFVPVLLLVLGLVVMFVRRRG